MDIEDWEEEIMPSIDEGIDLEIDRITPCLEHRVTHEFVNTFYKELKTPISHNQYSDWAFDWAKTQRDGYRVFQLFDMKKSELQGMISMRVERGFVHVDIAESAPHNRGVEREYFGAGAHLFAIACKVSFDNNCDGFVDWMTKTDLLKHYIDNLGAKIIEGRHLYLDTDAARRLVDVYIDNQEVNYGKQL